MKRSTEIHKDEVLSRSLPDEIWDLIIDYVGLQLVLDPVCKRWLSAASAVEQDSVARWVYEVADSDQGRNYVEAFGLMHEGSGDMREWCRRLRGIPNLLDRHFCRSVRRVLQLNAQLAAQLVADVVPREKRLLDNLYLLWTDRTTEFRSGGVLRVLPREHFNHLLRMPIDTTTVVSPVIGVPADDRQCSEQHICLPSGQLRSIPLARLQFSLARWGWGATAGDAEHRIASLDEYRTEEEYRRVVFVHAAPGDDVLQYLRDMHRHQRMCQAMAALCVEKRRMACELLPSVWYGHCREFSEATMRDYDAVVARGDTHWAFADRQMASDLCDLMLQGLLVVDAKGTRVHAPISYSDAELEYDDETGVSPFKAYVRVYVPRKLLLCLSTALPRDICICIDQPNPANRSPLFTKAINGVVNPPVTIPWPDMAGRAHQIEWEKQAFGMDRMPDLLDFMLVEFVDAESKRPDGYLFSTLLALCQAQFAEPSRRCDLAGVEADTLRAQHGWTITRIDDRQNPLYGPLSRMLGSAEVPFI